MNQNAPSPANRRWVTSGDPLDLGEPAFHLRADAPERLAYLAAHEPVRWNDAPNGRGFWAVTGHEEARAVLTNTEIFSSDWKLGGFRIFDLQAVSLQPRPTMLSLDGPAHVEFRRALMPLFAPDAIAALAPRISKRARSIVSAIAPNGAADFMKDLAIPMTMGLLLDLLDTNVSIAPQLREWMDVFIGDDDPDYAVPVAVRREKVVEFDGWAHAEVARRRETPGNDIISLLTKVTINGEPLDFETISVNLAAFLVAAQETTRHSMAFSMLYIDSHEDVRGKLIAEPGAAAGIAKDLIRLASPLMHTRRTAVCDTQLGNQKISKGDRVVVWLGAANRDPRVYERPHDIQMRGDDSRSAPSHLAFGAGPHFCMGWRFAELQLAALLEAVFSGLGSVRPVGEGERLSSNFLHAWKSLPIRFTQVG